MNLKPLAAALAMAGLSVANAVVLDPTSTSPEATFYIAGASAQKAGILANAKDIFFATPADVVYITSTGTKNTTNYSDPLNFPQGSVGFYGMSKASLTGGTSKRLLVLQSSANGSAAGINQVIAASTSADEAQVVTVGSTAGCTASGTSAASTTGVALTAYKCSGYVGRVADMALSDVRVEEFLAGAIVGDPSTLNSSLATHLGGFGVAANSNMYRALQQQNVFDGVLPATCATGAINYSGGCQPSITKSQYLNVAAGFSPNVSDVVPNATLANYTGSTFSGTGAPLLRLMRRVITSGTQAASNIYFLNNACGALTTNQFDPVTGGDYGPIVVTEGSQTDDVIDGIKDDTAGVYALGVISLEKKDGDLGNGRFVKINGSSPTYPDGVTLDSTRRKALIRGNYDFATLMAAYWGTTPSTGMVSALLAAIKDPALSNLGGVAYLQGSVAGKSTTLVRDGNDNCKLYH